MDSVSGVGVDGCGICIELCLSDAEGGVGWLRGRCGDRSQGGVWETRSDGSDGGSGGVCKAGHGDRVGLVSECCQEKDEEVHEDERLKKGVLLVLLRCTQRG